MVHCFLRAALGRHRAGGHTASVYKICLRADPHSSQLKLNDQTLSRELGQGWKEM